VRKKRISGGKRRTLARMGVRGKLGRPPLDEVLLENLRRDLAWIGKPNATDSAFLLSRSGFVRLDRSHRRSRGSPARSYYLDNFDYDTTSIASDLQLIWQLQTDDRPSTSGGGGFDNTYYKGINERTLRRYVAIVQGEIWGPKK
jgi:hypothetical protein